MHSFIVQDEIEIILLFNYRYHKILEQELTRGCISQIANFQLLSIGSLRSGLLGNPTGGLHFCHYRHYHLHPWHKCLDWSAPKSNHPIFWVILDLQSSWDFLGPNRSSLWSLVHILLPQYQRIWFHVGHSNSHGSF